ncbi:TetR/AcrR family transcriptional regulator [uncultured Microbacterium sp.]|uniref:TetR/AcrR family transcriptional regulator n=1 Tax=uncultured Microbacterium sp. TaxID=191216 RepID=UPI0025EDF38C|nr:TetR/AcrR family transcriptional regulator [uncultured Microbacterium sp.]
MSVTTPSATPDRRTRRPHAVRADEPILAAIRERLIADPHSSMAQLADAAGVGMSAIYSRFGNREALLRRLAQAAFELWESAIDRAHASLDDGRDGWDVLDAYLRTASAADVLALGMLLPSGGGGDDEWMLELRARADALVGRLHERQVLRPGVTSSDLGKVLEAIGSVRGDGPARTRALKARLLDIAIDGLRPSLPALGGEPPEPRDFGA